MAAGGDSGAAAGPLASVRVPREGERAAIERVRNGALSLRAIERRLRSSSRAPTR
jgi:hypothetical protein